MNLAIKGHYTRGEEVIKILEMLGGINVGNLYGDVTYAHYFINNNYIDVGYVSEPNSKQYLLYSLEEFEKKFSYKVGDKVLINDDENDVYTITSMRWNGSRVVYKIIAFDGIDDVHEWFADEMNPYKEETMEERKYADLRIDVDQDDKLATEATIDGDKITPPNNYLIGKITKVDNGMLVEFVKKQPQYPKTYKECCGVLKIPKNEHYIDIDAPLVPSDYNRLVSAFTKLLICRDAYWRIAGKQMGLGKPWKPHWKDFSTQKYSISIDKDEIITSYRVTGSRVLVFPTAEMRDAFYENFKDLIEQCKELL